MRTLVALIVVLSASSPALAQDRVVLHSDSGDVELFVSAPATRRPSPVILFVHGHQAPERPGARAFTKVDPRPRLATIDEGRLETMRARGYLAAAVSLPGYGDSSGPPDFCGPRSQAAVRAALDHLLSRRGADKTRVIVYGVSRGAATAAMEATTDRRITALVLVAGLYDLGAAYPTGDGGLDANIEREAGTTPEAFAARAALRSAETIGARVLILHGGDDNRGGALDLARRLAERLGARARLRVYPDTPHQIPMAAQWETIDPFLHEIAGR